MKPQFQVTGQTLGTEETKSTEKNVILYPNPTKPGEPTFIKAITRSIKSSCCLQTAISCTGLKNLNNQRFSLVNENLPKGVYFVKVHTRKLFTLKLIIQ